VQRPVVAALGGALDDKGAVILLDLHPRRNILGELAERAVDLNATRADCDVDAAWQFDWLFSDSAHWILPLVKMRTIFTR